MFAHVSSNSLPIEFIQKPSGRHFVNSILARVSINSSIFNLHGALQARLCQRDACTCLWQFIDFGNPLGNTSLAIEIHSLLSLKPLGHTLLSCFLHVSGNSLIIGTRRATNCLLYSCTALFLHKSLAIH